MTVLVLNTIHIQDRSRFPPSLKGWLLSYPHTESAIQSLNSCISGLFYCGVQVVLFTPSMPKQRGRSGSFVIPAICNHSHLPWGHYAVSCTKNQMSVPTGADTGNAPGRNRTCVSCKPLRNDGSSTTELRVRVGQAITIDNRIYRWIWSIKQPVRIAIALKLRQRNCPIFTYKWVHKKRPVL